MGDEKNVFLRIVREEDENDGGELTVDFGAIFRHLKRWFAVWLCLAVALGSLSGACGLLARRYLMGKELKAAVRIPSGYDIAKVSSPGVIEDALNETGMETSALESIRKAINIEGLIPNSVRERMSMYYNAASKQTDKLDALNTLLGMNYQVSDYVISFNYPSAGMSQKDGANFLNALLRAYQDYCVAVYNSNSTLRNPLGAIDYREYDYAEAANIFDTALGDISSYISQVSGGSGAGAFRSNQTGLTFSDLSNLASSLKGIDLDRVTSYIVIHSVSSNPPDVQITYYEWLIENIARSRAVQRTRLESLTDSINAYEKDSIVILAGAEGASVAPGLENLNAAYDAMIQEKLDAQAQIASYNRSIAYYETVIEGFRQADGGASNPEDVEAVKADLESLNQKITELAKNVSLTANEYYERAAFSNQVPILLPAVHEAPGLGGIIKVMAVLQALLFLGYLCVGFVGGVREANSRKEREEPSKVRPEAAENPSA